MTPENGTGSTLVRRAPQAVSIAASNLNPIELGNVLAQSGFFQDSRDAAQAAVKVMAGAELGFGPVASMTGIYIVKGRVTLSANLMAAAIKAHPKYTYRIKTHTGTECSIEFFEEGESIGVSTFTMDDAKTAGLAGGDNWKKHTRNMLFARALSNGAKWFCPDAFGGGPVYTPDELGAEVDGETGEVVEPRSLAVEPIAGEVVEETKALDVASVAEVLKAISRVRPTTEALRTQLVMLGAASVPDGRITRGTIQQLAPEQAVELVAWLDGQIPEDDS